jgi:hypothetical protein
MTELGEFALFLAVGAMGMAFLLGPIGQGFARLLSGRRGMVDAKTGLSTDEVAAERIATLEARVHELEQANSRMGELEERLDFAERMLAQLPPGATAEEQRNEARR